MTTTIVIPTRNRPDLLRFAIDSVVGELPDGWRLVVSNNSSVAHAPAVIEAVGSDAVVIQPPSELAMSTHWEWALQQVDTTHVTYLTDRMVFRRGMLQRLAAIQATDPDSVIVYDHLAIEDTKTPIRVVERPASDKVAETDARLLLQRAAGGKPWGWDMPRMLNCVVPTAATDKLRSEFGHVFSGDSPDFHFAFHILAADVPLVTWDQVVLAHHSQNRSNGRAQTTGVPSDDSKDFTARAGAPLEQECKAVTVQAAMFHELLAVSVETDGRIPSLDLAGYVRAIQYDIDTMTNRRAARTAQRHLDEFANAHGVDAPNPFNGPRRFVYDLKARLAPSAPGGFGSLDEAIRYAVGP